MEVLTETVGDFRHRVYEAVTLAVELVVFETVTDSETRLTETVMEGVHDVCCEAEYVEENEGESERL
ncbi:MAG: hypothetical protein FJ267_08930 [Planctomycetes bacterium]|nr:hypothetical protein [Planctomycetota bacterium]